MITQQKKSVKNTRDTQTLQADSLIREYKQKRWTQNSERINKPDSLSAWYNIEEMENFLAFAKSYGGDGIRFYYGAYPEDFPLKPEYAGRQTLVLVATKSKSTGMGSTANKDIYYMQNDETKILSFFTLPGLCPPICPPNSEGGMGNLGTALIDRGDRGMEIV